MQLSFSKQYEEKLRSADEVIGLIKEEVDIVTPILNGEPHLLMKKLESYEGLRGNRLFQMFTLRDVIEVAPEKLKIISMFLGAAERKAFKEGKIDLLPNHFSDIPKILHEITKDLVVMATVSPMDEHGYFSLGTNCDHTAALIPSAKTVLLEVNEYMPRTFGENQIHISQVSAFTEHHESFLEAKEARISDKDRRIGEYIAQLIKNGDTLQIGFGSIPNAIMDNLGGHRHLSIHTEMIPEKIIELFHNGAVTNENNPFQKGKMTATFAYGSQKLYDFLHENRDVYMMPVNKTNHIYELASMKNLVTVNATVEVDFLGQANSEMIGDTYWSSTGGQADFQVASRLTEGGRGILCLNSTTKNDTITKIVPILKSGSPVSTSKNDIDYVVTEYGIAKLRGKTVRERTKELIHIAHPKFRDELTFEAKKMGYII